MIIGKPWVLMRQLRATDFALYSFGLCLAVVGGMGVPVLVDMVGVLLDLYLELEPQSEEFRTQVGAFMVSYILVAAILLPVAFFEAVCCRFVARRVVHRARRQRVESFLTPTAISVIGDVQPSDLAAFEADLTALGRLFGEHVPAIAGAVGQAVAAVAVSLFCAPFFAPPTLALSGVVFMWNLVLTHLLRLGTFAETLKSQSAPGIVPSYGLFVAWLEELRWLGTKKALLTGGLTGGLYFFLFAGMGLAAVYGNWLLDTHRLASPGLLFVVVCALVPAATRLGQIQTHWDGVFAGLEAASHIGKRKRTGGIRIRDFCDSARFRVARKETIIDFVRPRPMPSPQNVSKDISVLFRNLMLHNWSRYSLGFVLALLFAAAPPVFTKLNGDLFEFYGPETGPYFQEGIDISWEYWFDAAFYGASGILAMFIFGVSGESVARILRKRMWHAPGFQKVSVDRQANFLTELVSQCRKAVDMELCRFSLQSLSFLLGIVFALEKNFMCAFLCSLCFVVQAAMQIGVCRASERLTCVSTEKRHKHLQTFAHKLQQLSEEEMGCAVEDLLDEYEDALAVAQRREIAVESVRSVAVTAFPQFVQALAYLIGSQLAADGVVRPLVVYKIVQTLYMSTLGMASITQFCTHFQNAKRGATKLDQTIPLKELLAADNAVGSRSETSSV